MRGLLRGLGRWVYSSILPATDGKPHAGAESFLVDLWDHAPREAALAHALMAAVVCVLPPVILSRLRFYPGLERQDQEAMILKMLQSSFYPLRLLASAVKGSALMAILREPSARASFLAPNPAGEPRVKFPVKTRKDLPNGDQRPEADYVIVGSGAGGAAAAVELAEGGKDVLILEEGQWYSRDQFGEDVYSAVSRLFRGFGTQVARGRAVIPVLQGCCVGGSTVISGAITHRLPKAVFESWCEDPGIREAIGYAELEEQARAIEGDLGIKANLEPLLPSLPVSAALKKLGWAFNAMERSAPGCQGTGRCLQGCPSGGKWSMEASYIPRALAAGARLFTGQRVIGVGKSRVVTQEGEIRARKAVLLAAGAIHTPLILKKSGLGNEHVGRHFQCHLGVAVSALLPRPVVEIEGPPQGIEVTRFEADGFKLATQLVPPELMLARTPVVGGVLADLLRHADRISTWTGSVRSDAEGTVEAARLGGASVRFSPSRRDMERMRAAIARLTELHLELGASRIFPNIAGLPAEIRDPEAVLAASLDPRRYAMGMGHLFGTCRMGGDPRSSVVGPDFQVHGAPGIYVLDASVFPTNTGVNPQLSIMTLARLAARRISRGR